MVGIACNERNDRSAFGIHHLLVCDIHFPPRTGFFEGGRRTGSVPYVGYGDLYGVFVHGDIVSQYLGTYHRVLGEVHGASSSNHEKSRSYRFDFYFGKFNEILYRIDGEVFLRILPLVFGNSESGARIRKSRTEYGYSAFVTGLYEAVFFYGMGFQPFACFPYEFTGGIGALFKTSGYFIYGIIALLEFFLVDKGVVYTVDIHGPEFRIRGILIAFIMFEPEGFEQIHVDYGGSRSYDAVDHFMSYHVYVYLHASGGTRTSRDGEDVGAFGFFQHPHIDVGSRGRIP